MTLSMRKYVLLVGLCALASSPAFSQSNSLTPRQAMRGFLEAANAEKFEVASEFLDLGTLSVPGRKRRAPELARQLKEVLDHTLWVNVEQINDTPEGDPNDGLEAGRDLVGTIRDGELEIPIYLDLRPGPDKARVWRVSSSTLTHIPELYEAGAAGPLEKFLPAFFFEVHLLGMELWQVLGLLLALLAAVGLGWLAALLLLGLLHFFARRTKSGFDDDLLSVNRGPLRLLLVVLLFAALTMPLGLRLQVLMVLSSVERALAVAAIVWAMLRSTDLMGHAFESRLASRGQMSAISAVTLGRRTLKLAVLLVGALEVMQNVGLNVSGLLAGLGIGGLAFALAAQKTVENLFGGVTLIADQPVRVGDLCRFGNRVGTIEEIGLRSTRIRTPERTVVSVPNGQFSTLELENFARRDRIAFQATLNLHPGTTPTQMRKLLEDLRGLLEGHPKTSPDPMRVNFVRISPASLDVELFAHVLTRDMTEFLGIQQELLLRAMEIVDAAGAGFAPGGSSAARA